MTISGIAQATSRPTRLRDQNPSKYPQKTERYTAGMSTREPYVRTSKETKLLHVNLPIDIVNAIRALALEDRRSITSMVSILLEESPDLVEYLQDKNNPRPTSSK